MGLPVPAKLTLVCPSVYIQTFVHASTAFSNCVQKDIDEIVYQPPLTPTQILTAIEYIYVVLC